MKWNHIRDKQPTEDNGPIIQIHRPYECGGYQHYTMGMMKSTESGNWDAFIEWCKSVDHPLPDYWWIYGKDFPFPDKDENDISE